MARIDRINNALVRIGALPVLSDDIPAARPHVEIHDAVLGRLASQPLSFLRSTRRLVQRDGKPEGIWLYAYDMPAESMGPPRAVYYDLDLDPLQEWDIEETRLLANKPQIWATITTLANVARWPGDFVELVNLGLMAEFALSVREDRALHDRIYQKAFGTPRENGMGGLFATVLENDAQGTPSTPVGGGYNPLVDVRG